MYLILIFLPLIGSICSGFFGRQIGHKGSCYVTLSCIFISLIISFLVFYETGLSECPVYIKMIPWINSEFLNVDWGFMFDSLTATMCLLVFFISFVVHMYSIEYMSQDPHLSRFMAYLSLFTFFMIILVTADNFIQLFVGWEGVGLSSFLLINFWFTRLQANKAAIKAMLINRVSDIGLILAILTILVKIKAVDYSTVFSVIPFYAKENTFFFFEFKTINLISFFLFVGAIGKSAQLGLHTWLPDAMEGPTPVSALIHAATMVTAGIFLIIRCSPILEYAPDVLNLLVITGACTTLFGSTVAVFQNDIKKIIAYSTCSQLGYMMFACGLSNYSVAIFHLINHAFFKALLFLCAGSIIHSVFNEQDIRKMGGLRNLIPFTYSAMITGTLSLIGFPFLSGFYSKEAILENAWGSFTNFSHFGYVLGILSVFFTSFYSLKIIYFVFLTKPNGYKIIMCNVKEPSFLISISLLILILPSIIFGYYGKNIFTGIGSTFWGSAIFVNSSNLINNTVDTEYINIYYKLIPVLISLLGVFIAFVLYNQCQILLYKLISTSTGNLIYNFFNKKWFFDKIYTEFIGQFFFKFGYKTSFKSLDKGLFEILGPKGISSIVLNISKNINTMQSGYLHHYTFMFLFGSTFLIGFSQFWLILGNHVDFRLLVIFVTTAILINKYEDNL